MLCCMCISWPVTCSSADSAKHGAQNSFLGSLASQACDLIPQLSAGTVEAGAGVGNKRKLDDMAALEEEIAPAAAPGTRVPNFVSAGELL